MAIRWNGADITGIPTLIYHDELITNANNILSDDVVDGPGSLICRSEVMVAEIIWERADSIILFPLSSNFVFAQVNTTGPPSLSQLSIRATDNERPNNGLWQCMGTAMPTVHVGVYSRAFPGELL